MTGKRKTDIFYPWYVGDYQADTMHLDATGHGIYRQLLDAYWMRQGPLPAVDSLLMQISRATPAQWRALKPTIAAFFTVTETHWSHRRVEKEIAIAKAQKAAKSSAGKLGNQARWGHQLDLPEASQTDRRRIADGSQSDGEAIAEGIPNPIAKNRPSPSPSPSPENKGTLRVGLPPSSHFETPPEQAPQPGGDDPRSPARSLGNHPPFARVLAWVRSISAEFSEADVKAVWDDFEATAVDGIWFWGRKPVANWQNAFSRRLADDSVRRKKAPTAERGMGACFPGESGASEPIRFKVP